MSDKNAAQVDFEKWARHDTWYLEEGANLLSPFNNLHGLSSYDWERDLCYTARKSILAGTLRVSPGGMLGDLPRVSPRDFLAWARKKAYRVPSKLEKAVNRFHPEAKDRPQGAADRPTWPWGSHETKLLRHLVAAANKFWKLYDPSDPTTAPTNQQVIDWLMKERGVLQRPAESIATILRADDLPPGPRKK